MVGTPWTVRHSWHSIMGEFQICVEMVPTNSRPAINMTVGLRHLVGENGGLIWQLKLKAQFHTVVDTLF